MPLELKELRDLELASPLGQEWDRLAANSPTSGFMQSLHWAALKQRQGLICRHVGLFDGEKLVGGSLFFTSAQNKGAGLLIAPEGPVIPWQDEATSKEAMRLLLRYAQSCATELDTIAVRIEPRLPMPVPQLLKEFGRAPIDLVPRETVYLDIDQDLEQVLEGMKPKGRYNTKLSQRKGVVIEEGNTSDIVEKFYPIMQEAGSRNNFAVEPLSFFIELAEVFLPSGMGQLFFAVHEGEVLGTLFLVTYGKRATYLYGGIGNRKRQLMAGYGLQWAAITAAKAKGCAHYDMYGFDQFGAPQNAYARFSKFKSLFNGQVHRFIGAHDYYFLDALASTVIRAFNELEEADSQDPLTTS